MERKLHNVVSLDKDRIRLQTEGDGRLVVIKRTTEDEADNFKQMLNHLQVERNAYFVWDAITYRVSPPVVVDWDSSKGELTTEYFSGQNLEVLLLTADQEQRTKYVGFLKAFINWQRRSGTVWKDTAPRNILISEETNCVCIVDFEKGNVLKTTAFSQKEFKSHIRGIVFEEACAFLFPEEQELVFGDIWTNEEEMIPSSTLRGKREPLLYKEMFGEFNDYISNANLQKVQKFMSDMVTPFYLRDGRPFFPLTLLANAGSPVKYVSLLLALTTVDRENWPEYLINSTQQ